MSTTKIELARKFVQVSLPAAFAEALREQATQTDRSMAAQIEHYAKIARAVELIAPTDSITRVKNAKSSSDIVSALASFVLDSTAVDALRSRLQSSGVARYGSDPNNSDGALMHLPDGSVVAGKLDDEGIFSPNPPTTTARSKQNAAEPEKPQRPTKHIGRIAKREETRDRVKVPAHA